MKTGLIGTTLLCCMLLVVAVPSAQAQNLVTNPGFDAGGTGWSRYGSADFQNWAGNPGEHAVFYSDSPGNFGGIYQTGIAAAPLENYRFSIDALFEGNWDAVTEFGLEFYESDGMTYISGELVEITEVLDGSYNRYTMYASAPDNPALAFVRPRFSFHSAAGNPSPSASFWDNAELIAGATYVIFTELMAARSHLGIRVEWETAAEIDNAGFHVWRSEAEDGSYSRLTDTIIPAEGGATWGARYNYEDEVTYPGRTYFYKLQDIDFQGHTMMHGPVWATAPSFCGTLPNADDSPWGSVMYLLPLVAILLLRGRNRAGFVDTSPPFGEQKSTMPRTRKPYPPDLSEIRLSEKRGDAGDLRLPGLQDP